MNSQISNVMSDLGSSLDPSEQKKDETVYPGQRHPPREAPTKRLVTPQARRAKRKAAKAARKRNRR
jgi:hypothetical protein